HTTTTPFPYTTLFRSESRFSYTRQSVCRSHSRQVLSAYFGSTRASPAAKAAPRSLVSLRHWSRSPRQSRYSSTFGRMFFSFEKRSEEHTSELQSPDHL